MSSSLIGENGTRTTSDKQRWSFGIIFDVLRVETRIGDLTDRGNGIRMIGAKTTRV